MGCGLRKQPFLFSLDFLNKAEGSCDFTNPVWSKLLLEHQEKKGLSINPADRKLQISSIAGTRPMRLSRVLFMKKRARLERRRHASRPAADQIGRKVRVLKKLIPNCSEQSGSVGLDNLFRETADYILALQLRAKVMQIMVDVLTGSN